MSTDKALVRISSEGKPQTEFHGGGESRDMSTQSGQTVALFQEAMMQEGGVYTIQFGLIEPKDKNGNGVPVECVATILASDRGNSIRRQMNIVKGAGISLAGRVFDVRVTDTTPPTLPLTEGTVTPGANSSYVVSCLVERGNRASESRPPTLYGGIVSLTTHASVTIPIPEDAGVISLEVSVIEATTFPLTTAKPNVTVYYTTPAGGVFKAYDPTIETGFVPIPPGATQVVIVNSDGAKTVFASLNFGIDG